MLLLPVQLSVLHVANPALTPTNLLYNVIATPGALARFARERRLLSPLTRPLLTGTLPGVVAGTVLRVEVLSGPRAFLLVVAAVLAPLGAWLALAKPDPTARVRHLPETVMIALAFVVGIIGGVYGIGGGSLLGPALAYCGYSLFVIAPATLTTTFLTSAVGVIAYQVMELLDSGATDIAPVWALGISMGIGGIGGSYIGARLQSRVPERRLRQLLGVLCVGLAIRYVVDFL